MRLLLSLVLGVVLSSAWASADAKAGAVLVGKKTWTGASSASSPNVYAAALGALVGRPVPSAYAAEVESLLSSDIFNRPQTIFSLAVAGADPSAFAALGSVSHLTLTDKDLTAHAGAAISLSRQAHVLSSALDHDALKGCDAATCQEDKIRAAAEALGAHVSADHVQLLGAKFSLEASSLDRAFLTELAAVREGLARAAARPATPGKTEVLEGAVSTLQAVRMAGDDKKTLAAQSALVATVQQGLAALEAARGGKEVAGVVLATSDLRTGAASETLLWKTNIARRRLLADAAADELTGPQWTGLAQGVIVVIVFVISVLLGLYAMLYMPFAEDQLLFGKQKGM
jgi:hypothetical protein